MIYFRLLLFVEDFYHSLRVHRDAQYVSDDVLSENMDDNQMLEWYKSHVKNNKEYVGEEVYALISMVLGVNLFVLTENGDKLYNRYSAKSFERYFDPALPSIVIMHMLEYRQDGAHGEEHYESIGIVVEPTDIRLQFAPRDSMSEILFSMLQHSISKS